MSQPQNNDGLFILAAFYARQAFEDAQYNNKVNAYVSRGYTINEANHIVRTWYLAYAPRRWNVDAWRLTYIVGSSSSSSVT